MDIAKRVLTLVIMPVGRPIVVNRYAAKIRQNANGFEGFVSSGGMEGIIGQAGR